MQIRVQVGLEHGIFFLCDAYSDPEIPPDTGAAPFTYTDTCICFWSTHYVDGTADVTLSDQLFNIDDRSPDFVKKIRTPSKVIALSDSSLNYYCMLKLRDEYATINIWNFELNGHRASWVQVFELDLFD